MCSIKVFQQNKQETERIKKEREKERERKWAWIVVQFKVQFVQCFTVFGWLLVLSFSLSFYGVTFGNSRVCISVCVRVSE